jgi:hypothetical protein
LPPDLHEWIVDRLFGESPSMQQSQRHVQYASGFGVVDRMQRRPISLSTALERIVQIDRSRRDFRRGASRRSSRAGSLVSLYMLLIIYGLPVDGCSARVESAAIDDLRLADKALFRRVSGLSTSEPQAAQTSALVESGGIFHPVLSYGIADPRRHCEPQAKQSSLRRVTLL